MRNSRKLLSILAGVMLACLLKANVQGQEKKEELEKKSGAVVGELTAKGPAWIEVKADGEQKARRYVPSWVGGAPQDGGGPDKEIVKIIKDLTVGSRLRLEWKFEERPRIVKVEVLKRAPDKDTPEKEEKDAAKKGSVTGRLTAKEDNWIEVKADGEEKARRYFLHQGGTKEVREAIQKAAVDSRVRIDWLFAERPRVVKMELIKGADKDR
jgi:hypothetical protein